MRTFVVMLAVMAFGGCCVLIAPPDQFVGAFALSIVAAVIGGMFLLATDDA